MIINHPTTSWDLCICVGGPVRNIPLCIWVVLKCIISLTAGQVVHFHMDIWFAPLQVGALPPIHLRRMFNPHSYSDQFGAVSVNDGLKSSCNSRTRGIIHLSLWNVIWGIHHTIGLKWYDSDGSLLKNMEDSDGFHGTWVTWWQSEWMH